MAEAIEHGAGVEALVIGAGPVGLTMACELARHGVSCRVVDREAGPTDQSRALALWERTLEVFHGVGIIDRVLAQGRKLHGMTIDAEGRRLAHIGLDLDGADTAYPFALSLPQGETERILIERLADHGLAVDRRTVLVGLRQDEAGVTATLTGPDGGESDVRARWLVGCDGAASAVRHKLGLAFEGAEYDEAFLLADVRVDWGLRDDEGHVLLLPDGGAVAAFPLPEPGRWRLIDASGAAAADDPAGIVGRFRDLLHANGHPEAVVSDPRWTSAFRIHRRIAGRFRVGRCFVAGDAAHIHSPVGGQGMNTGIQDAHNLAWKLGLVVAGAAGESLLDSFEAERRPIALGVLRGTDLATRVVTLRHPIAESARNALAGVLIQFDAVRRRIARMMSELDLDYRGSPIVAEDGPGASEILRHPRAALAVSAAPRAGDRAPDVVLAGQGRLSEALRGTRHSLLLFGGAGDETPRRLAAIGESTRSAHGDPVAVHLVVRGDAPIPEEVRGVPTIRDPDGALHRRYGVDSDGVYLIRPDGYVGYRGQPADAEKLGAFLGGTFLRATPVDD